MSPIEDLARLEKIMKEATLTAQGHGIGVHPHVVGAWLRHLQRIREGLAKPGLDNKPVDTSANDCSNT